MSKAFLSETAKRSIFIGKCPDTITDGDIFEHYASLGPEAIQIIRWAERAGRFKGFGYIQFSSLELATRAAAMPAPVVSGQQTVVRHQTMADPKRKARVLLRVLRLKRQKLGPLQEAQQKVLNGETLQERSWTETELRQNPFVKDFHRMLRLSSDRESQSSTFFKQNSIRVENADITPVLEFWEITCGASIMAVLKQFERPMPIQSVAWPIVLRGRDCVGLAKTGSGKTLAYTLPAILHLRAQKKVEDSEGPIVLVIGPTRELVLQIALEAEKFKAAAGIMVGVAYGGRDGGADRLRQARRLLVGCDIVAATPGRLLDFVEAGVTPLGRVTYLVLDEADQLLEMGFEPQVRAVVGQVRPDRQTLMFSATWNTQVETMAESYLKDPAKIVLDSADKPRANLDVAQHLLFVDRTEDKQDLLVVTLQEFRAEHPKSSRTLVFVKSRASAEAVETFLQVAFPKQVWTVHGDVSQAGRERALAAFRAAPSGILVATDVASRGLDIKGLECVINYDLPRNITRYVHRIGRTGRAGEKGLAVSFFHEWDARLAPSLAQCMRQAKQPVPPELDLYARTRRAAIAEPAEPTITTEDTKSEEAAAEPIHKVPCKRNPRLRKLALKNAKARSG